MKLESARGQSELFFADTGVDIAFGFYHWLPSRQPASRFAWLQAPRCLLSELVAMAPHLELRELDKIHEWSRTMTDPEVLQRLQKARDHRGMEVLAKTGIHEQIGMGGSWYAVKESSEDIANQSEMSEAGRSLSQA